MVKARMSTEDFLKELEKRILGGITPAKSVAGSRVSPEQAAAQFCAQELGIGDGVYVADHRYDVEGTFVG